MPTEIVERTSFITPDGVEYTFDSFLKTLLTEEGLGMPEINYITQQGPFQHGQTLIDYRLAPRIIQLLFRYNGRSRAEFWSGRADLLNALRPNRSPSGSLITGTIRKIFQDGSIRDVDVVSIAGPVFAARSLDKWDEWGFTETLRFLAHDPTFYDPTPIIVDWLSTTSVVRDLFKFPITFPISFDSVLWENVANEVYAGTWMSFPKFEITGPVDNFVITNISTGEFIHLNYDVKAGEVVTIDLPPGNKTVVNSSGENLIGTVTEDSDLVSFHLAAAPEVTNGVNVITLNASALDLSAFVRMTYNKRYIGI